MNSDTFEDESELCPHQFGKGRKGENEMSNIIAISVKFISAAEMNSAILNVFQVQPLLVMKK